MSLGNRLKVGRNSGWISVLVCMQLLSSCGLHESNADKGSTNEPAKKISVNGYFKKLDGAQNRNLLILGEYANFSRACSEDWNDMGPIGYAREVVKYGNAPVVIPSAITKKNCVLNLVSIQVESNEAISAFSTAPNRMSGDEVQQCYLMPHERKACLSGRATGNNKLHRIGEITLSWKEIQ